MTDVILPLARAWREHFRAPSPQYYGSPVPEIAHDRKANASHCAALAVTHRGSADAEWLAPRLGELLRLVHLATASHVDPLVLNALWNDDAVCGMGPSPCARCDALDRDGVTPTVTLDVTIRGVLVNERSNTVLVHDALYAWQEVNASDAFHRLRDALVRDKDPDTNAPTRPPVLVTAVLGFSRMDEDRALRDVQALVARRREVLSLEDTDALPFRLARIELRGDLLLVRSPLYAPLLTALVDTGVTMRLPPSAGYDYSLTRTEPPRRWQWLLDRPVTGPRVLVGDVRIVHDVGLTAEMLAALLRILVTENPTLRRLQINWSLATETDAAERQRMGHVIGEAIFAPHAGLRLDELFIDLGNLSDDDVVALQQGVAEAQSRGDGRSSSDHPVESHVRTVKWRVIETSSANIDFIARSVGALHVRELEFNARPHSLPCRLLKAVLEACAKTITTLKWDALACVDVHELESTAPWSHLPSRLRNLRVHVPNEQEPHALRVVNALLTHVGPHLTDLALGSNSSMLSDRMAESMIARCPRLRTLEVENASPEFIECLVRAYDDGRCRVSTLKSITGREQWNVELLPLLQALRDTASGASRTLRALTIAYVSLTNPMNAALLDAVLALLATNTTLLQTELLGFDSVEAIGRFQELPLPFQFAVRLPLVRQRLALLSVCERRKDDPRPLVKLSPEVLEIVWTFAGRRVRRYKLFNE